MTVFSNPAALAGLGGSLGPTGLVGALTLFAALFLLGSLLNRRGILSKHLRRLAGSCFVLTLVFALDASLDRIQAVALGRAADVLIGVGLAFVILHGVNFVYGDIVSRMIRKKPPNQFHLDLIKFAALIVYAFGFFKITLAVDVGALFTSSAILTAVAVLSMQDTIASLIAGIVLQVEKPFKNGDHISVAGLEGKYAGSSWRHTVIETPDQNILIIPNNQITKEKLINFSAPIPEYRLHLTVGVSFDAPPVKVKAALREVLAKAPVVCKDPPPVARLKEFSDSKTIYELLFYVPSYDDGGRGRDEVLSQVWYQFKRDGIALPYPARDIRIHHHKAGKRTAEIALMLRKVPLFAGLPEDGLDLLATTSALITLPPGGKIVTEGEMGSTLFIILEGEVGVFRKGGELARLGPGDFFGEIALLTGEPRQADVSALTKAECLEVDREGFRVILEKNPDIIHVIRDIFASRGGASAQDGEHDAKGRQADNLFQRFLKVFT